MGAVSLWVSYSLSPQNCDCCVYSFNYDWFVLGIQAAVCQFKGFQWSFAGRKSRGKTKHHTIKKKDHLCRSLADPDINIWLSVKELSIISENPLVDLFLKVDAVITVPFCWKILRNQSHRKKNENYTNYCHCFKESSIKLLYNVSDGKETLHYCFNQCLLLFNLHLSRLISE